MKHEVFDIPDNRICTRCGARAGMCDHTPAYPHSRAINVTPKERPHAYSHWTNQDEKQLERLWREGESSRGIARILQKPDGSVAAKISRLGLTGKQGVPA